MAHCTRNSQPRLFFHVMDPFTDLWSNFSQHLQETQAWDQALSLFLSPFSPILVPYVSIKTYLESTNPLYSGILLCTMFTFVSWFLSILNRNWSQV